MSRRRLIIIAVLGFAVFGFFVVRAPAPVIALAAEPIADLGFMELTNTILSAWVVIFLLAIAAFFVWRRTRDVESALVPSGFQNLVEAIYEAFPGHFPAGRRGAQREEVLPLRVHDLHLPADRQLVRAVPLEQRDRAGRELPLPLPARDGILGDGGGGGSGGTASARSRMARSTRSTRPSATPSSSRFRSRWTSKTSRTRSFRRFASIT